MPSRAFVAAVCAAVALPVASASAQSIVAPPPAPAAGTLSAGLTELASPALRTASRRAQNRELQLPAAGPASLERSGAGDPIVEITVHGVPAQRTAALRQAGADLINVSTHSDIITASVPADRLEAVSEVPGVERVVEALSPEYSACSQGSLVSEGDQRMNVATARQSLGVSGVGVKVGVLSDSWDKDSSDTKSAADDVASNDLPGAPGCNSLANVADTADQGEDEGRAMAQIVHDMAPESPLLFRQGGPSESAMADNVRALQAAGAKVIVDDVTFFSEPMFQPGLISNAVRDVTNAGSSYFSSAANSNVKDPDDQADGGAYEASQFRPAAAGSLCLSGYVCHSFNSGDSSYPTLFPVIAQGGTLRVNLQWAQPQRNVTTDLDVFVVQQVGNSFNTVSSTTLGRTNNAGASGTQVPFDLGVVSNAQNALYYVAVARKTSAGGDSGTPRFKLVFGGITEQGVSAAGDIAGQTIFGHNGAELAQSVAAQSVPTESEPTPLGVDTYSSRGPVTLYFGPVTGGNGAATPLTTPQVLNKPDVTASDCNRTTFFNPTQTAGVFRFCGTSAAAPHAAGVAALQLQRAPNATPAQILAAQRTTATAIPSFGATAAGTGLINAPEAVKAVATPTQPSSGGPVQTAVPTAAPTVAPTAAPTSTAAPTDRTPPKVKVSKKPKRRTTSTKATITFSKGDAVRVTCKLDKAKAKACKSPLKLKKLKRAKHTLVIVAVDAAGNPTIKTVTWKVVKKKK